MPSTSLQGDMSFNILRKSARVAEEPCRRSSISSEIRSACVSNSLCASSDVGGTWTKTDINGGGGGDDDDKGDDDDDEDGGDETAAEDDNDDELDNDTETRGNV